MSVKGKLAFYGERPMVGIDPHPAFAPERELGASGAEGWARAYGVQDTVKACHASRSDDVFDVVVHDDGRMEVWTRPVQTPAGVTLLATHTAEDIYARAFAMDVPSPFEPGPSP